jgi:hypothetical protein
MRVRLLQPPADEVAAAVERCQSQQQPPEREQTGR